MSQGTDKPDTKNSTITVDGKNTNNSKSSELLKKREIPNTPFTEITTPEGRFLMLGKYRLSEDLNEINTEYYPKGTTADQYIHINQWNIITQLCGIMLENWNKKSEKLIIEE